VDELLISPWFLAALFFLVAVAYSSVGLGGGSSYTALMAVFGMNYVAIPSVTLVLNLVVTTVGSVNFIRKHHARFSLLLPFLVSSIPMAYLGGSLRLPKEIFYMLLLGTLVVVALRIYVWESVAVELDLDRTRQIVFSVIVGSVLGFAGGTVGIGGGIYLVPLIVVFGLGSEKEAAACGSIFIWLTSVAGLAARLQRNPVDLIEFLPLMVAVLAGGLCGSYLGATRLSPRTMRRILGLIVLTAIVLLVKRLLAGWLD
jgi:uncharacterized membrane protein YfcA